MIPASLQKLLIYIGTLVFVAFIGYRLFTNQVPIQTELTQSEVVGQDIISLVEQLKMVSIDKSIFSSDIFNSLIDFNVTINPENKGRINPFAPIELSSPQGGGQSNRSSL